MNYLISKFLTYFYQSIYFFLFAFFFFPSLFAAIFKNLSTFVKNWISYSTWFMKRKRKYLWCRNVLIVGWKLTQNQSPRDALEKLFSENVWGLMVYVRSSRPKVFLEISKNSQENTCARVSFFKILKNHILRD